MNKIIKLGLITFTTALPAVALISCGKDVPDETQHFANISLDYTSTEITSQVTFSGQNGRGVASFSARPNNLQHITISVSKSSGLSNNENIRVTAKADQGYSISGKEAVSYQVTVHGLTLPQTQPVTQSGTHSNTQTQTSSPAPTQSGTHTNTQTQTPTQSGTHTNTQTQTPTPTPTQSGTHTNTQTQTPSPIVVNGVDHVVDTQGLQPEDEYTEALRQLMSRMSNENEMIALPGSSQNERMSVDHFGKFTLVGNQDRSGMATVAGTTNTIGLAFSLMGPIDSLPKSVKLYNHKGEVVLSHNFDIHIALHPISNERVEFINDFVPFDGLKYPSDLFDDLLPFGGSYHMERNADNDIRNTDGTLSPQNKTFFSFKLFDSNDVELDNTEEIIQAMPGYYDTAVYIVSQNYPDNVNWVELFKNDPIELTRIFGNCAPLSISQASSHRDDGTNEWSYFVDSTNMWYIGYDFIASNPFTSHPQFNDDGTRNPDEPRRW